jgi:glutathione S-transferase kappa 1
MIYVKDTFPAEKLEAVSLELWVTMWEEHKDLSKPEMMRECLSRHFSAAQVDEVMAAANTPAVKTKLLATTDYALQTGAFGCPWFVVTNNQGVQEPFFGSDRYVVVISATKCKGGVGTDMRSQVSLYVGLSGSAVEGY